MRTGAAKGLRRKHPAQNRNSPSRSHHHPSRALGVGLAQANTGVHAVSKENENERPHKFAQPIRVRRKKIHETPLPGLAASRAIQERASACAGSFWLTSAFSTFKRVWGSGSASGVQASANWAPQPRGFRVPAFVAAPAASIATAVN